MTRGYGRADDMQLEEDEDDPVFLATLSRVIAEEEESTVPQQWNPSEQPVLVPATAASGMQQNGASTSFAGAGAIGATLSYAIPQHTDRDLHRDKENRADVSVVAKRPALTRSATRTLIKSPDMRPSSMQASSAVHPLLAASSQRPPPARPSGSHDLLEENERLRNELRTVKQKYDGEAVYLRERVSDADGQIRDFHSKMAAVVNDWESRYDRDVKRMQTQLDALRTELVFKDNELQKAFTAPMLQSSATKQLLRDPSHTRITASQL